ncbi:MAG: N-acetylglucosamine-6-phosphate deacetylase [Chloroflexota bacterium]
MWVLGGSVVGAPGGTTGFVVNGARIERWLAGADTPPGDVQVVDLRPHVLAPGTIDVHTHGAVECSFSSGPAGDTHAICRYRAQTGCTGLLATITGEWDELLRALDKLGRLTGTDTGGAALLGIHVEGPFLNAERKGAIGENTIRPPSIDDLHRMQDAAMGAIRMMTVAPEVPGAIPVIQAMVRAGIVPSAGHTDATYEALRAGIDAGVRKSTHTFNAMRPLHHRDPGAVGAILADDRIVAELIADGAHVHAGAIHALINAKSPTRVALVTDGVRYAGLPEGVYERPGRGRATIRDGIAVADDGTIAGSVSPMDRNLGLLRATLSIEHDALFTMAATVPAALLGLALKGALFPGMDADFAAYNSELRCVATFIGGRRLPAA